MSEALSEALFALSDRLRASGFLDDDQNHAAYEKVVAAFTQPTPPDSERESAMEKLAILKGQLLDYIKPYGNMRDDFTITRPMSDIHLAIKRIAAIELDVIELTTLRQRAEASDELLHKVFLHGHAEGWAGNQSRRDVQYVDAEKSWSLYVSNGALEKVKAALEQDND